MTTRLQALSQPSDIWARDAVERFADRSQHQRSADAFLNFKVRMEHKRFRVETALREIAKYRLPLERQLVQLRYLETSLRDGVLEQLRYHVVDLETGRVLLDTADTELPVKETEAQTEEGSLN